MAYNRYNILWESEFDGTVSNRDKLQDANINQSKLEVHDTYEKDEKRTTNFEADDDEDVINKAYLDEKLEKIDGHISCIEKDYNEFKLQYNKQSVEDILIRRAVKTTIQIFYDKGLFDNYANFDKALEDFMFTTRRREDLSEQVNDNVQWFYEKIQFEKQSNMKYKNSTCPFIFIFGWCWNLFEKRTVFKWYWDCIFTSIKRNTLGLLYNWTLVW